MQEPSTLNLLNLIHAVNNDIYWSGTIEKRCQEADSNSDAVLEVFATRVGKYGL